MVRFGKACRKKSDARGDSPHQMLFQDIDPTNKVGRLKATLIMYNVCVPSLFSAARKSVFDLYLSLKRKTHKEVPMIDPVSIIICRVFVSSTCVSCPQRWLGNYGDSLQRKRFTLLAS